MPIEFACPNCQARIRTPDTSAGKKARCPNCAGIVPIPGDASASGAEPSPVWVTPSGLPSPFAPTASPTNPYGEASTGAADGGAASSGAASNPYASSMTSTSYAGGYLLPPVNRQRFLAQLRIPAIFILIAAILSILYWGTVAGSALWNINNGFNRGPNGAQLTGSIIGLAIIVVPVVIVQGLAIVGAICMLRGSSYMGSMSGAVATLIPCSPCCLLGVGFGIWALVLLCRPEARAAFP